MWASLHKLLQEDIKKLTKEVTKGGRSKQWEETNHPSTDYPAFIVLIIITWALYSKFGAVYVSTSGLA